jgi:lysophospholipase L1-like esterase
MDVMNPEFKYFKVAYIIFIHVLLVTIAINSYSVRQFITNIINGPDELTKYYYQMTAFHNRVDKNLTEKYNIFIGDSLIQGLAVSSVAKMSVNYGIGNDTTFGVIERLPIYNSIYKAQNVILSVGHNDIGKRRQSDIIKNFQTIIEYIPKEIKVIICSIFLIDDNIKSVKVSNIKILKLNNKIKHITENYSNVTYLDINQYLTLSDSLSSKFHIGDGVHLNKKGNEIWIRVLKEALTKNK